MSPAVRVRLQDMLTYAQGAGTTLRHHGRTGIDSDWALQQGLIKALEVVGEAASKVPVAERPPSIDIPWEQIIGLRHHLVHGYGAIRMEVLFGVVEPNVPILIAELEQALREDSE